MPVGQTNRRAFIAGLGGAAAWPVAARAQRPAVWRVGYLSPAFSPLNNPVDAAVFEAFRRQMNDLGYVEGKNLIIESRYAEGQFDRLPTFANELVSLPCDVIVAVATPAIAAAQRATTTIPIVMSPSTDPIGSGFIKSLARPEGNITGVANLYGDVTPKSVDFLHAVLPNAKKIAVLLSSNPTHPPLYEIARASAQYLGLLTIRIVAPTPADLDGAFQNIANENCDALFVLADPMRPAIITLATTYKLPSVYQISLFVDAGGLASYGANLPAMFSLAATYVDKILKGSKPAEIPVEQPTKFEYALNLKTAKFLGLSIPESVILRADKVVE
jgi:putative tryptophan/tyrosine transport system substrate-binding protein